MSTRRRYVVRLLSGYRRGDRRWVVWDTVREGWADDTRTTRRDAQDVCDELNAKATATADAISPPQPAPPVPATNHPPEPAGP